MKKEYDDDYIKPLSKSDILALKKYTVEIGISEPDDIIMTATQAIAKAKAKSINNWLLKKGVTIENAIKYKIKSTGNRYDLYPARGRNAKKIIS